MITMPLDPYSATWISHSSLSDFLVCPRSYYLKNVYKDPVTNHKVQVVSPALSLGQAVHEVLESLSIVPTEKRFQKSLIERFDVAWKKVRGKKGGFSTQEAEQEYKVQGEEMLRRVMQHPGPLENLAVKINQELPHFWLSEDDNIILCGKVDWLEYLADDDAVHIIDFKTSKREEAGDSLQLPIYYLLVSNCQKRSVAKASYWYLRLHDTLTEKELPDADQARRDILEHAKKVALARKLERFVCPQGELGCRACQPFERILKGEGEKVGVGSYGHDLYFLTDASRARQDDSVIL